jgi:hypothetical protein
MRRPVSVKAVLVFLSLQFSGLHQSRFTSQAASVAILPFALFVSDGSLGARWMFSFQRVLLPDYRPLSPSLGAGEVGPGPCRSHPDSAVKLGCFMQTR